MYVALASELRILPGVAPRTGSQPVARVLRSSAGSMVVVVDGPAASSNVPSWEVRRRQRVRALAVAGRFVVKAIIRARGALPARREGARPSDC